MQTNHSHRSSLFLFELMIAILFFILAATFSIRLLVKSNTIETENVDRNHAVTCAVSIAEILRSETQPMDILSKQYPLSSCDTSHCSIYYDDTWTPCSESDAIYRLDLNIENKNDIQTGSIFIYKDKTILYSLTVKKHQVREAS